MNTKHYDAIVVGARCAGAATALLLARQGLRVLVIDRSRHGADTLSTHALMRGGVSLLARWGVLPRIVDAGAPAITSTTFHYGARAVELAIEPRGGVPALFAPRRTVIDAVLVDAAREAGAEVRYGVSLQTVRRSTTGRVVGITAKIGRRRLELDCDLLVGADGVRSTVAGQLGVRPHVEGSWSSGTIYGYWPDLPRHAYHWYYRPGVASGVIPTNDGLACVFVSVPATRFADELRHDVVGGYRRVLHEAAPELAAALRESPTPHLRGFAGHAGYLRRCIGDGWALVGDAGYFKDPLTAHGMTDALRDAQLLADAVAGGSLTAYEDTRDQLSRPFLAGTDAVASFQWDLSALQRLHRQLADVMKREVAVLEAPGVSPPGRPLEHAAC